MKSIETIAGTIYFDESEKVRFVDLPKEVQQGFRKTINMDVEIFDKNLVLLYKRVNLSKTTSELFSQIKEIYNFDPIVINLSNNSDRKTTHYAFVDLKSGYRFSEIGSDIQKIIPSAEDNMTKMKLQYQGSR